jgi:NTE family protein
MMRPVAPNELTDIVNVLEAAPLFGAMPPYEREALARASTVRSFARGDEVFREGDAATSCFVVISGEVDVTTGGRRSPVQVRRLGPHDLFGELGVLLGRNRTATVRAARPATVLELPAAEFRRVITSNPRALGQISNLLAARLVSTTRGDRTNNTPRVVCVTGEARVQGRSLVAAAIAAILHDVTDRAAVWLELAPGTLGHDAPRGTVSLESLAEGREALPSGPTGWAGGTWRLQAVTEASGDELARLLGAAVDHLRAAFTFVVVDPGNHVELPPAAPGELGDVVVHVSHKTSLPPPPKSQRRLVVLNLHDSRARPVPVHSNEPFVLRNDPLVQGVDAPAAAEIVVRHRMTPASRTLHRLVRTLLGSTVGVALGGGAAFGLAHVGVLEALDRHRIPVDVVVGTSMGSIVATAYAAGMPTDEMHVLAERIGRSVRTFVSMVDLNPLRAGVLSGRKLQRTFNPLLGSVETFDDLIVPCRTVAADIESGERVCIDRGRLEDAFRASSSIPLLVAPWLHGGHVLVDGAMVDPVPAEVTREMGADLCLAVNVVPHLRKGVTNVISRTIQAVSNLNPLSRTRPTPNVADTAMNTIQSLQHELGHFKAASADVRINPELADITWIEFYRAPEIIERGERAVEESLPAIHRVLAERLAAALPG